MGVFARAFGTEQPSPVSADEPSLRSPSLSAQRDQTREEQARGNIEAAILRRQETFRLLHLEPRVDGYRATFVEGGVQITESCVDEAALEDTPSPELEDLLDKIRSLFPKPKVSR